MALQLSNACIMPTIISARPRERIFLYYRLYIRYATDRKDRGNKRYYFVRRVAFSSRSPPPFPIPLARTYFNCSALLTRKEGKKTLVKREGWGEISFIFFSMEH